MLKYRVKEDAKSVNYEKIDFEPNELSISLDSESISGVFNRDYQIQNQEEVGVKTVNNSDYTDLIIQTRNISRSGEFDTTKVLDIHEITEYNLIEECEEEYAISDNATYFPFKCYKFTKRYVILPNGDIVYESYEEYDLDEYQEYKLVETYSKQATATISQGSQGYFDLKGYGVFTNTDDKNQLEVPITCYVDNGVVIYEDIEYNFDENYELEVNDEGGLVKVLYIQDEDGNTLTKLSGYTEYEKPILLTQFVIERPKDINIAYDNIITATRYLYVIYQDTKYTLKFNNGRWRADIKMGDETVPFYYNQTSFTYDLYEEFTNYTKYLTVSAKTCNGDIVEYRLPIFEEYRPALGGDYLFIYTNQNYNFSNGKINIKFITNDSQKFAVYEDLKHKYYIMYFGRRIYLADLGKVKETYKYKIAEYIENDISTETKDEIINEFDIDIKDNTIIDLIDNNASSKSCIGYYYDKMHNESAWQLERKGKRIRAYKRGTIIDYGNGADSKMVKFHDGSEDRVLKQHYKLNVYRYVTIDGIDYKTNISKGVYEDDLNVEPYVINVDLRTNNYELDIIEGYDNWFICKPHINVSQYIKDYEPQEGEDAASLLQLQNIYANINDDIVNSLSKVSLSFVNVTFGEYMHPTAFDNSLQNIMNIGAFELYKKINCISIPVNFHTTTELNLQQEDIVNSDFYLTEKEKALNPIIDMEKDIYYPVIDRSKGSKEEFENVLEIKFNIHLRTRDLETWKINNKTFSACTKDEANNLTTDNWNVLDNYHQITGEEANNIEVKNKITQDEVFSSDLLYFLNITEDDVFYQKSKIGKSFLRLSFYDSTDPNTQNLLHYSTIFMNENLLYKKYINNIDNEIYTIYNKIKKENRTYCNVNTEPIVTKGGEASIDYTKDRLDASFSVVNRYETDTSSEGFYLYMFKEYGTKLRPSPVFMKVEFNHAGEGKTIPLVMPTIKDNQLTCMAETINSQELTTELENENLLNEFKEGLPLSKVLINQYIRLEVKYDEINHRYVYYVPQEYMNTKNNSYWKDNKLVFNLWELKIKDES